MTGAQRAQRISLILHSNYLRDAQISHEPASVELFRDLISLYATKGDATALALDLDRARDLEAGAENRKA